MNQTFMPIAIDVADAQIVIVGGGRIGLHKAQLLSQWTSSATVVAEKLDEGFSRLPFRTKQKRYEVADLQHATIVYACTENAKLNQQIKRDARARGAIVSVCDDAAQCQFISPAIMRTGDVSVAVTSNGTDVYRSIRIRNRLRELLKNDPDFFK